MLSPLQALRERDGLVVRGVHGSIAEEKFVGSLDGRRARVI
ncbi:MAG: hypothetical protein U9R55_01060 [Pseudomonadota bacterium]|nr:hypothetical protein [Pseudomonadota bacterium]